MIWKNAMKYPVLAIGVILFILYWNDPKTATYWQKHFNRFVPNTCQAVVDRSLDELPEDWNTACPGTQLLLIKIKAKSLDSRGYRSAMYKQIANSFVKLAFASNPETLEVLKNIKIVISHPKLEILAQTDGEAVVGFLTLKGQAEIARHLRLTVKVKENIIH